MGMNMPVLTNTLYINVLGEQIFNAHQHTTVEADW
jgi:hypothetical protein